MLPAVRPALIWARKCTEHRGIIGRDFVFCCWAVATSAIKAMRAQNLAGGAEKRVEIGKCSRHRCKMKDGNQLQMPWLVDNFHCGIRGLF